MTPRARRTRAASALFTLCALAAILSAGGCIFSDEKPIDEGIVRSERADIFSSTALVALKVGTVKQGDRVDIMKRASVTGPTYTEEWLNIRLKENEEITGWIEARHVVSQSVVNRSAEVAGQPADHQAIGRGRLKVNQKLRLAPGRTSEVATVLPRGTEFDIIGKAETTFTPEAKEKPKPAPGAATNEEADEPSAQEDEEPESTVDVWYRVRLDEGSIIRGGYILAQSVNLEVPDEILHLEGEGRRFVAWQVVGTVRDPKATDPSQAERKNYVTFMRRAGVPDDVDFERVYCLFWDPDSRSYYSPFVDSDLRGVFPISQRDEGGRKVVTAHVLNAQNEPTPIELEVTRTEKGRWTVRRTPLTVQGERIRSRR